MAQRCSFCGAWEDDSARRCASCGERLRPPSGSLQRIVRLGLILTGAILVGVNLPEVVAPVLNARAAVDATSTWAFLTGVIVLMIGFVWR